MIFKEYTKEITHIKWNPKHRIDEGLKLYCCAGDFYKEYKHPLDIILLPPYRIIKKASKDIYIKKYESFPTKYDMFTEDDFHNALSEDGVLWKKSLVSVWGSNGNPIELWFDTDEEAMRFISIVVENNNLQDFSKDNISNFKK